MKTRRFKFGDIVKWHDPAINDYDPEDRAAQLARLWRVRGFMDDNEEDRGVELEDVEGWREGEVQAYEHELELVKRSPSKHVVILEHPRGNHSPEQIYHNGKVLFEGTAKEARGELLRMRNEARAAWRESSTADGLREYVEYKMGDTFAIDITDGVPKWFI